MADNGWMNNVDLNDGYSVEVRDAYAAFKEQYRRAQQLRERFEAMFTDQTDLGEGEKVLFGYRFGKLSIKVTEDDGKPQRKGKPKQTLAEYLAERRANGLG